MKLTSPVDFSCASLIYIMKKCIFTFDDGLETHFKLAAPVLKEYLFNATFFVTGARKLWYGYEREIREDELEWDRVADMHHMGFEIGNHTWSHYPKGDIRGIKKLEQFLMLEYGILTRSFSYPTGQHTTRVYDGLKELQYEHARKGYSDEHSAMEPKTRKQVDYFTPDETDPLLICCTGLFGKEADYDFDLFRADLSNTPEGSYPVFCFHGLRGLGRERYFEKCVEYLNDEGWQVIALRDLNE